MYSYVRFYGTRLLGTSGYKELIFISPIFTKELVPYTFIRKSGYKEHIFIVLMSSLYKRILLYT